MKIIAGVATTGKREESLELMMDSLKGQVDEISIYDNSFEDQDLTDNGKFYGLQFYNEPIYFFSVDDDLIYPPDYVETTLRAIEKYQCIVTYHGRILRGLNRNYYDGHSALNCKYHYPQTREIDVAGTGCAAFSTEYFNPTEICYAEEKRKSDLVFSLEAAKQDKKIIHIGHKGNWIKYINQPEGTTIYEMECNDQSKQIELANQIWSLKY